MAWIPGYCTDVTVGTKCKVEVVANRFTIHGIWPQKAYRDLVLDCGKDFSVQEVERLNNDLETYMPALTLTFSDMRYWKYEWNKNVIFKLL